MFTVGGAPRDTGTPPDQDAPAREQDERSLPTGILSSEEDADAQTSGRALESAMPDPDTAQRTPFQAGMHPIFGFARSFTDGQAADFPPGHGAGVGLQIPPENPWSAPGYRPAGRTYHTHEDEVRPSGVETREATPELHATSRANAARSADLAAQIHALQLQADAHKLECERHEQQERGWHTQSWGQQQHNKQEEERRWQEQRRARREQEE